MVFFELKPLGLLNFENSSGQGYPSRDCLTEAEVLPWRRRTLYFNGRNILVFVLMFFQ